ncbi:MAG: hypothetical protein LBR88_07055 [Zoogloeaceae bacterium]|nr:hypothetical protein [Zoogloeaceae bacterium]
MMINMVLIPRKMRTPGIYAEEALNVTSTVFTDAVAKSMADDPNHDYGELANPEKYFKNKIFDKAWDNPETDGDKSLDEIRLFLDGKRDPDNTSPELLQLMNIVVAYSVQAIKAEKDGRHEEAWTYAVDAQCWGAALQTLWSSIKEGDENPAVAMATLRHVEHNALKADAIKYWRENIDPNLSAEKAANMLTKVVPLSHKVLAAAVAEAKKKRAAMEEAHEEMVAVAEAYVDLVANVQKKQS